MKRIGEWFGTAHRGHTGPLPGTKDEVDGQRGGNEVQAEAAKDLVHAAKRFERTCQGCPQRTTGHPGQDGQEQDQGGGKAAVLKQAQGPGGGDGAEGDLSLHADVPQSGRKSDDESGSGDCHRCPGHQRVRKSGTTRKSALPDELEGLQWRSVGEQQKPDRRRQCHDDWRQDACDPRTYRSGHALTLPPINVPTSSASVSLAASRAMIRPSKRTRIRSEYVSSSSMSADEKTMAVPSLRRSSRRPQT